MSGVSGAFEELGAARDALELLLLLEATNVGVERDAGLKRRLDEVTSSRCAPDTTDSRVRIRERKIGREVIDPILSNLELSLPYPFFLSLRERRKG